MEDHEEPPFVVPQIPPLYAAAILLPSKLIVMFVHPRIPGVVCPVHVAPESVLI
jgi:hypothetical protein